MSLKLYTIIGKDGLYVGDDYSIMRCSWGMHTPFQYNVKCEISKENFKKYKYCIEQFEGIIKDVKIENDNIIYFNLTCPKNTGKLKRFLFKITRYLRGKSMFEIIENFYNLHQTYGDKYSKIDILYVSHLFAEDISLFYNTSMDLFYNFNIFLLKSDTDENFFNKLKNRNQNFENNVFKYKYIAYPSNIRKEIKENIEIKNIKNIENIIKLMKN